MADIGDDTPSPGWYGDPRSVDHLRYWDGSRWTEHRQLREPGSNAVFASQVSRVRSMVEASDSPTAWSSEQRRHVLIVVAVPLALVVAAVGFVRGFSFEVESSAATPDQAPLPFADEMIVEEEAGTVIVETTTTTVSSPAASEAVEEDLPPGQFGAGLHAVGTDIEPGLYRVSIAWARLDEERDVIDNDLALRGVTIMRVFESDAFVELSGDARNLELLPTLDPIASGFTQGTYLVGVDVEPGTYRVTAEPGATAFAARLDDALGVIAEEQRPDAVEIELVDTDFAVRYTGVLEPVS